MAFDRKAFLKLFAPRVVQISVMHGDEEVKLYARELSTRQVFQLQEKQKREEKNSQDFMFGLIAQALCDENGEPVMSFEEAKELADMEVQAFNRLGTAVAKAVGLQGPEKADEKPGNVSGASLH